MCLVPEHHRSSAQNTHEKKEKETERNEESNGTRPSVIGNHLLPFFSPNFSIYTYERKRAHEIVDEIDYSTKYNSTCTS